MTDETLLQSDTAAPAETPAAALATEAPSTPAAAPAAAAPEVESPAVLLVDDQNAEMDGMPLTGLTVGDLVKLLASRKPARPV